MVITLTIGAIVAIGALVWSAGHDQRWTAFSLDVDPGNTVTVLGPRTDVCQGPIHTIAPVGIVVPWVTAKEAPGPALTVTVRDGSRTGPSIATGHVASGYSGATAPEVVMDRTVPQGTSMWVCLRSAGPKPVDLVGNPVNSRSGTLTVAGKPQTAAMSFLFLRPHPVSLLSQIPAVFTRAALFRPTGVGAWTFWLLAALVVAAFGAGIFAVVQAGREDARSSERASAQ